MSCRLNAFLVSSCTGRWQSLVWAMVIALCGGGNLNATPPDPPVRFVLDLKEIRGQLKEAKGEIRLPIKLRTRLQVPSVSVSMFVTKLGDRPVPSSREPAVKLDVKFEGKNDPDRGQEQELTLNVPISGPGRFEVDIRLQGKIAEGNAFSDRAIRQVWVEKDGSYRVLTSRQGIQEDRKARQQRFDQQLVNTPHRPDIRLLMEPTVPLTPNEIRTSQRSDVPPEQQLQVRPSGPSATQKRYSIDRRAASWSPEDPITVRGRLMYLDFDNVWRPLVNVSVNLWDEDWDWDEHLGTTATDWNGNWSFSVNNDDGWLANGRDIYYSFKLENTRIRIQDCDGIDSTYEWESSVHEDLDDGAVVDFGTETGGSNPGTMRIWNHLNLAWNHAVTVGGQDPGFVDCCFPYDETHWDRFWEEIDIEDIYEDGPDVVKHEYAHAIMYYAYDEDSPSPGGSHSFDDMTQDAGLSWSEGWGTAFALSAGTDGSFNWHEGDGGRSIENFSSSNRVGERNEGRVAAALLDMLDVPNDGNGGDEDRGRNSYSDANSGNRISLATMLRDTIWGSYHVDALAFYYSLLGELDSSQSPAAQRIMYYNWMSVIEPGSCVASRVAARDVGDPDTLLSGLRQFRDQALEPFDGGRRLATLYYRNSPEMALILLRDAETRKQAIEVMTHFSRMGYAATHHQDRETLGNGSAQLVPPELRPVIERILGQLEKEGSPELKQDLREVREVLEKTRNVTVANLQHRVGEVKARRGKPERQPIRPWAHNPASEKANSSKELRDLFRTVEPPEDQPVRQRKATKQE